MLREEINQVKAIAREIAREETSQLKAIAREIVREEMAKLEKKICAQAIKPAAVPAPADKMSKKDTGTKTN